MPLVNPEPCVLVCLGNELPCGWPLQVLVYHDLLGMMQHPHHAKVTPKFCKQYAAVGQVCYCRAPNCTEY